MTTLGNSLVSRDGGTLALSPPLVISDDDEIDQLFDRLGAALDRTAAESPCRAA